MGLLAREPKTERLRRKGDIEGLRRAADWHDWLRDRDGRAVDLGVGVRRQAVTALAGFEEPRARQALHQALLDDAESVRIAAAEGVSEAGDQGSVRFLVEAALDGGSPRVRRAAVEAMARIDPGEGALELAAAVTDTNVQAVTSDHGDAVQRLLDAAGDDGRWVAGLLATAVARSDDDVASRAEQLIRFLPGLPCDPFLSALGVGPRRGLVARALGHLHDVAALEPLIELVDDPDPGVRWDVVWALGELKHPNAVDALLRATVDPEYAVREAAIAVLDQLGNMAIVFGVRALVEQGANQARQDSAVIPPRVEKHLGDLADELVRRVRSELGLHGEIVDQQRSHELTLPAGNAVNVVGFDGVGRAVDQRPATASPDQAGARDRSTPENHPIRQLVSRFRRRFS
jgi:HEAT repeat protein